MLSDIFISVQGGDNKYISRVKRWWEHMQPITRGQIKAGRDLLGMTQQQFCEIAGIPLITLRRIEGRADHTGLVSDATVANVKSVMEGLGIDFVQSGDVVTGPGVALRDDDH